MKYDTACTSLQSLIVDMDYGTSLPGTAKIAIFERHRYKEDYFGGNQNNIV